MMRSALLMLLAALAIATPIDAQWFDITQRGRYVVMVDSVAYSQHNIEREALQSASEALAGCAGLCEVWIDPPRRLDVTLVGLASAPDTVWMPGTVDTVYIDTTTTTPPDPDPTPDPDPDPVPPGDAEFSVDWSRGVLAGGQLQQVSPSISNLSATPLSGAPPPWSGHGLDITVDGQAWHMIEASGWQVPAAGETLYYRLRVNNRLPAGSGIGFEHGMQTNIGQIAHGLQFFSPSGGSFQLGWFSQTGGISGNHFATLPADTHLTVQWALTRTGSNRATVEIRVINDETGQQIADASSFRGNWGEGSATIADFGEISTGPIGDFFGRYMFGTSGSSSGRGSGLIVADFAVSRDGWVR